MDITVTTPTTSKTFNEISEGTVFSIKDEEEEGGREGYYIKLEHIYQTNIGEDLELEQVPDTLNEYLADYSEQITVEETEGEDEEGDLIVLETTYQVKVPLTLYNAISLEADNSLHYFSDDTAVIEYIAVNLTLQQ